MGRDPACCILLLRRALLSDGFDRPGSGVGLNISQLATRLLIHAAS